MSFFLPYFLYHYFARWLRGVSMIAAMLLMTASVFAQQSDKGLDFSGAITPMTGRFAGLPFYKGSRAVIVGVSRYQNLSHDHWLQFADKDACDVQNLLIKSYGFPPKSIKLLLNEQATKANIEAALDGLANGDVGEDDRVLIYFSGHGQTIKTAEGGEKGFLIPYDARIDLDNPANKGSYFSTCIEMDSLWSRLSLCAARHALIIADACYGGILLNRSKGLGSERPNTQVINALLARPARQVLTAGGAGETAIENTALGHGAFTFKLLEELTAQAATPDNVFTASELATSLKNSVANLTGARQTPTFGNYNASEGEFLFVTTRPHAVAPIAPVPNTPLVVITSPSPSTSSDTKQLTYGASSAANTSNAAAPQHTSPLPASRTAEAALAAKVVSSVKINPQDGAEMVYIPTGVFPSGDDDQPSNKRRMVNLTGYWMYKNLVTVGMYRKFCQASGHKMPQTPDWGWQDDHPIVNVSWNDATAYCAWANVRLPTEEEWEKAARGATSRQFPWGDTFAGDHVGGEHASTAAVGAVPGGASPFGVLDLEGNVMQWCSDTFHDGTDGEGRSDRHVLRGSSWNSKDALQSRVSYRQGDFAESTDDVIGFRCVVAGP